MCWAPSFCPPPEWGHTCLSGRNLTWRKLEEKKGAREESCRAFPRGAKQADGGRLPPAAQLPAALSSCTNAFHYHHPSSIAFGVLGPKPEDFISLTVISPEYKQANNVFLRKRLLLSFKNYFLLITVFLYNIGFCHPQCFWALSPPGTEQKSHQKGRKLSLMSGIQPPRLNAGDWDFLRP